MRGSSADIDKAISYAAYRLFEFMHVVRILTPTTPLGAAQVSHTSTGCTCGAPEGWLTVCLQEEPLVLEAAKAKLQSLGYDPAVNGSDTKTPAGYALLAHLLLPRNTRHATNDTTHTRARHTTR
jgi:hypothetical protein